MFKISFALYREKLFVTIRLIDIFLVSAIFPAIVALTGAFAGLWSSLYSKELQQDLTQLKDHGLYFDLSHESFIAVLLFVIFFILFALQQSAQNRIQKRNNLKLESKSLELQSLIENLLTLPPDGFLHKFQTHYRKTAPLQVQAILGENLKKNELERDIRTVLKSLVDLAGTFEGYKQAQSYESNIMLCVRPDDALFLGLGLSKDYSSKVLFHEGKEIIMSGIYSELLVLLSCLSSRYEKADKSVVDAPDDSIEIILPVHKNCDAAVENFSQRRFVVLPGAPYVARTHSYAAFESINEMLKWCSDKADFTDNIVGQIKHYFSTERGSKIRSFISIPLLVSFPKASDSFEFGGVPLELSDGSIQLCLGVLNIHSDNENILGGSGYKMFLPIIEPFLNILVALLVAYCELKIEFCPPGAILDSDDGSRR